MTIPSSKFTLGLLVCVAIGAGALLIQARTTKRELLQSIASVRADLGSQDRLYSDEKKRIEQLNIEISGQQKALDILPGSLEVVRKAATLAVIDQLKQDHDKNPPAPRQKPPPTGPSGYFFPELLSDPEYNRIYAELERRMIRMTEEKKLRSLGLSDESIDKIVSVLTEHTMALTDYRAVSGKPGIPGDFSKQQNELRDRQLQALMGDETFGRWQKQHEQPETKIVYAPNPSGNGMTGYAVQSHEALVTDAKNYLMPKLALRLSYTEAPLQNEQADQLAEILANCSAAPGKNIFKAMTEDVFIQQASQALSPLQVQALRDFQAEQQASAKRAKLPKSSELPRNSR